MSQSFPEEWPKNIHAIQYDKTENQGNNNLPICWEETDLREDSIIKEVLSDTQSYDNFGDRVQNYLVCGVPLEIRCESRLERHVLLIYNGTKCTSVCNRPFKKIYALFRFRCFISDMHHLVGPSCHRSKISWLAMAWYWQNGVSWSFYIESFDFGLPETLSDP